MGKIISLVRKPLILGLAQDPTALEGDVVELEAPRTFNVGDAPDANSPPVSSIQYNAHGNAWLRQPHYEVHFAESPVKRVVPESEVLDLAVDMTKESKKKKAANSLEGEPDLSAISADAPDTE